MSEFEYKKAVLQRVPLLIGIVGHSSSGKTMSALRLATGINRVVGGDIAVIDTENRRATHYSQHEDGSPWFDFFHVPLDAPFSSLRYLAAIRRCVAEGATTVIVDQISFEHDGEGGYLDMHDAELADGKKDPRAWVKPKAHRRKLMSHVVSLGVNAIFLFRAQQKVDWKNKTEKGDPTDMGTQPISASSFIYEMTARFLLPSNSDGVPAWESKIAAENELLKRPSQFRPLFERMKGKPLSEEYGEAMAHWAQGTLSPVETALREIASAKTLEVLSAAVSRANARKQSISDADKKRIGAAAKSRKAEIESSPPVDEEPPEDHVSP